MTARTRPGRSSPAFVMLEKRYITSPEWHALSPKGVKMFLYLASLYNGRNNGDLSAVWAMLKGRGWRSKGTVFEALSELEKSGWIRKTRQGGKHRCNLYALTIFNIDSCGGKHDARPTAAPPNDWKEINSATRIAGQSARIAGQSRVNGHAQISPTPPDYPHSGPIEGGALPA